MQRYELAEGSKFWEVAVEGPSLTTRWGKVGAEPQVKTQTFASETAANAARDKLVAEKLKKGFRAAGKPPKKQTPRPKPIPITPVVPIASAAPQASGTIDHEQLVATERRTGGGRTGRILIDGKRVMIAGEQCLVSSNGTKFHRRKTPGESFCLYRYQDAIYSLGGPLSVTRDFALTWTELALDDDFPWYRFCLFRDSQNTWWMGCDDGVILTAPGPEGPWEKSRYEGSGKILDIIEVDGRLLFMGDGSHISDGPKSVKKLKGIDKEHIICRVTQSQSGVLIAIGDGGVTYRSTDRGVTWAFVKSGVRVDLEDLAWVAGALFVVGGDGMILKSTDDGESWTKVDCPSDHHLWGITSWGDGALIGGNYGVVLTLAAASDPYWQGTTDTFAPPPPMIDPSFEPQRAAAAAERERQYTELYAQAIKEHDQVSVKSGVSRPRDANPRLAKLLEEAGDDDVVTAQVYADWLQSEGDPRGELAALQMRRATDRKNKELKKLEKDLLAQHTDRFLGKLKTVPELVKLKWHAGFIKSARIANTIDRDEEEEKKVSVADVVAWLLDEPSARFMRKLTVGIVTFFENDYGDVAERIGQRYLPAMRELFLGDFDSDDTEMSWSDLGEIEPIYAALPNLLSLRLRSGEMDLGAIVLPKLESFTLETGGLDSTIAEAICTAHWPSLRRLSLWVGSDDYGGDASIADFQRILDGAGLPRLEHLGLKNCELTDDLIEPLASSKILPQLKSLDLGMGVMSDDGVQKMYRLQKAFAHLEAIDLDDNYITSDGERLLRQTNLRVELGEQREDDGDPSNRYASAAE